MKRDLRISNSAILVAYHRDDRRFCFNPTENKLFCDMTKSAIIDEDIPQGVEQEEQLVDAGIITKPFDPNKIRVTAGNPTIDLIVKRLKAGAIDLKPKFQRKEVWNEVTRSQLIESIMIRIPLPAFYVDATDENKWAVVDGLQRLSTLKRFILEQDFALTGLEFLHDLNGCKFDDLPSSLQRRIEETEIVVFKIEPGTPPEVKFNIFKRINTGGLPLSAQEIRNAINGDRIRGLLEELAESDSFLKATRNSVGSKRMEDHECVIRFLAFLINDPNDYKGKDFDGFLNQVMADLNESSKFSDRKINRFKKSFHTAMDRAHSIFGEYAFRKFHGAEYRLSPINKALLEAEAVNLAKLSDAQVDVLIDKRESLLEYFLVINDEQEFFNSISQGTGAPARVKYRFQAISDMFNSFL